MAKALLVDTTKCTGCRACQVACKQWNELPAEKTEFKGNYQNPPDLSAITYTIVKFNEIQDRGDLRWLFRKHQCMQCTEASCIKVCPVEAITKNELGFKVRDLQKCIGCGLCVTNCPFEVPRLAEKERKVKDCLFCSDRVTKDKSPACSKACPSGAISFGERKDLLQSAYMRLSELKKAHPRVYLYGENELGGLGVMYILTHPPEVYDLPLNPQIPKEVSFWQDLFKSVQIASLGTEKILELVANYLEKDKTS
jgi:formate dehydrogenase iron-sulfur subunit